MHLNAQRPIFVPEQYWKEIEQMSKAALMDLMWDLATRCSGDDNLAHHKVMAEVRAARDIILSYRKQAARDT